jgi:hypothetical protein
MIILSHFLKCQLIAAITLISGTQDFTYTEAQEEIVLTATEMEVIAKAFTEDLFVEDIPALTQR